MNCTMRFICKDLGFWICTTLFALCFALQTIAAPVILSESAWPQFGADARGSRRSEFFGPTIQPILQWFFPTDASTVPFVANKLVYASPTIGPDGTIYATSSNGYIYAIDHAGERKWRHQVGASLRASATVAEDGSIFVASPKGLLHLDSSGSVLQDDTSIVSNDPSVTIGGNNRIYAADGTEMKCLTANGIEIWSVDVEGLIEGTPVVDHDGTIYFGSQTGPGYLNAIDDQGQLLWKFTIPGRNVKSATIGDDGTIYAGGQVGDFFAINPDGTQKWRFSESDEIYTAAALGKDCVVFAATNGIYALDRDGRELWYYADTSYGHGSVIADANGNIYATRNNRVLGFNVSGQLMWQYSLDPENYIYSSITLDRSGALYFGARDGVYAISVPIPEPTARMMLLVVAAIAAAARIRPISQDVERIGA